MRKVALFILLLPLPLLLVGGFFTATEKGLELMARGANRFAAEQLYIGRVDGSLLAHFSAGDIRLSTSALTVRIADLGWSWQPEALLRGELSVGRISLTGLEIDLRPPTGAAEAAPQPVDTGLPLPLPFFVARLGELSISGLILRGSAGETLLALDTVSIGLTLAEERLELTAVSVDGADLGLRLAGSIDGGAVEDAPDEAGEGELRLALHGRVRFAGYGFHPLRGGYTIGGRLSAPEIDLRLEQPASIRITGSFSDLPAAPAWQARVEAESVDLSTLIRHCPQIILQWMTAEMSGTLATYGGKVQAFGTWGVMDRLELSGELAGDGEGIVFPALRVDRGETRISTAGGLIHWREIFGWEGRFELSGFTLDPFLDGLPGPFAAEFSSRGDVLEEDLAATFAIERLRGRVADREVEASGLVSLNMQGVATDQLRLTAVGSTGAVTISRGHFSWQEKPSWGAEVRLDKFQPSLLHPALTGSVDGLLTGEGRLTASGPEGLLAVRRLSGNLAGHPLSGSGELEVVDGTLIARDLQVLSGDSDLLLTGKAGEELAMRFAFNSKDIGTFLAAGEGRLELHGSIEGSRDEPRLQARISAADLQYGTEQIGRLEAELLAGVTDEAPLALALSLDSLNLGGVAIDTAVLEIDGSMAAHDLSLDLRLPLWRLYLAAEGGADIANGQPVGSDNAAWRGRVFGGTLATTSYGEWFQQGEAELAAATSGVRLDDFCLREREGKLCAGASLVPGEEPLWSLTGEAPSFSLGVLNRLGLVDPPLSGRLSLDMALAGRGAKLDSGHLSLQLPDFAVDMPELADFPLHLQEMDLSLNLDGAGHLGLDWSGRLASGGALRLTAELAGADALSAPFATLPLRGEFQVDSLSLQPLAVLTAYEVVPSGSLSADLKIAGTPADPRLDGTLKLRDGHLGIPFLGLELADLQLALAAEGRRAKVQASMASGPGVATATGEIRYADGRLSGDLAVQGREFLAVDLPEYSFRVTPDLRLDYNGKEVAIGGRVEVPYGLIAPEKMKETVTTSPDVVIVDAEESGSSRPPLPLRLDVDVQLGEEVRIDGHGLTGRLAGAINVRTTTSDLLAGRGELELREGTFSLYGRSLDIARGRVLFTGGPIDNPGLDVRAQKTVGEEQARDRAYTVGVEISGLVQDLQYRLFSDPFMDDTEILSLMIIGQSLADTSAEEGNMLQAAASSLGVGGGSKIVSGLGSVLAIDDLHLEGSGQNEDVSLVLGKRITDDLYIGYDVNMFNQTGQFRVRYDLGRGFRVETKSSSEAAGADLLYSFRR